MTFIFWQNILSIHQSAFINALSKKHEVVLIVEKEYDSIRRQSGWKKPDIGCSQIVINPTLTEVHELLKKYISGIHILSGLEVTFEKYKLTRKLTKGSYNVICYLEPFNEIGLKGLLRKIKYRYLSLKYRNHLTAMLPTGEMGVKQYNKLGFKDIFEWGYFTEMMDRRNFKFRSLEENPRLLFVGSLDNRKNILFLLDAMRTDILRDVELTIIGTGPLISKVKECDSQYENIRYIGTKTNEEVNKIMSEYDILILPSVFDGWGAVVNEALSTGMRVICSDNCGAATLLKNNSLGSVFHSGDKRNFIEILQKQLHMGISAGKARDEIITWCNYSISGDVAADYFLKICSFVLGKEILKPNAPWIK